MNLSKILKNDAPQVLAVVVALIAVGIQLFSPFIGTTNISGTAKPPSVSQDQQMKDLRTEIDSIRQELTGMKSQINTLSQAPDQTKLAAQLTSISTSIENLQNRFSKIEGLIVQDPTKALEIPLMRKDIDNLKAINESQVVALKQDIERTYSLTLASIVALALAVLAPALGSLFRRETRQ